MFCFTSWLSASQSNTSSKVKLCCSTYLVRSTFILSEQLVNTNDPHLTYSIHFDLLWLIDVNASNSDSRSNIFFSLIDLLFTQRSLPNTYTNFLIQIALARFAGGYVGNSGRAGSGESRRIGKGSRRVAYTGMKRHTIWVGWTRPSTNGHRVIFIRRIFIIGIKVFKVYFRSRELTRKSSWSRSSGYWWRTRHAGRLNGRSIWRTRVWSLLINVGRSANRRRNSWLTGCQQTIFISWKFLT